MGVRRKARERALQILYQLEVNKSDLDESLPLFWQFHPSKSEVMNFAEELVNGTLSHLEEIDTLISRFTDHWSLQRIGSVERNVLRSSAYELLFRNDIPPSVTIDEAVEIARKYGTEDSGKFVNGVLDRIKRELELSAPPSA